MSGAGPQTRLPKNHDYFSTTDDTPTSSMFFTLSLTWIHLTVLLRSIPTPGEIFLWWHPTANSKEKGGSHRLPPCTYTLSSVSTAKTTSRLWQPPVYAGTHIQHMLPRGHSRLQHPQRQSSCPHYVPLPIDLWHPRWIPSPTLQKLWGPEGGLSGDSASPANLPGKCGTEHRCEDPAARAGLRERHQRISASRFPALWGVEAEWRQSLLLPAQPQTSWKATCFKGTVTALRLILHTSLYVLFILGVEIVVFLHIGLQ